MPKGILICGIPGSGKTTIGDYLAKVHDYFHINAEESTHHIGEVLSDSWTMHWKTFIKKASIYKTEKNVVITWGFMPGVDDVTIRKLQKTGYKLFWFDGNRAIARTIFLKRGTVSEAALNIQMAKINSMNLDSFTPIIIDPFNSKGDFRTLEDIAQQITNY